MNFKKRLPLRIGAQAAAIFRVLFLHRPLRRAPPRPRLVASGRTRFVSRSCTRATLFPSSRPATRHAHPLEKAELVLHFGRQRARRRLPRAVARRAPLLEARATAVAPAAAPTRARRARSNTVEGTRGEGGSPASPPLARSPQALFKPPPSATVRDGQTVRVFKQPPFKAAAPRRFAAHARGARIDA